MKNKRIGLINNSDKKLKLNFNYKIITKKEDKKTINKSKIIKDFDFILIYDKKDN